MTRVWNAATIAAWRQETHAAMEGATAVPARNAATTVARPKRTNAALMARRAGLDSTVSSITAFWDAAKISRAQVVAVELTTLVATL